MPRVCNNNMCDNAYEKYLEFPYMVIAKERQVLYSFC